MLLVVPLVAGSWGFIDWLVDYNNRLSYGGSRVSDVIDERLNKASTDFIYNITKIGVNLPDNEQENIKKAHKSYIKALKENNVTVDFKKVAASDMGLGFSGWDYCRACSWFNPLIVGQIIVR